MVAIPASPAPQAPPPRRVECRDCVHLRVFPYGSQWKRKTGCYHPEFLVQKQTERFLQEQVIPGDHEKINLRGDCAKFEPRPARPTLLQRVVAALRK